MIFVGVQYKKTHIPMPKAVEPLDLTWDLHAFPKPKERREACPTPPKPPSPAIPVLLPPCRWPFSASAWAQPESPAHTA